MVVLNNQIVLPDPTAANGGRKSHETSSVSIGALMIQAVTEHNEQLKEGQAEFRLEIKETAKAYSTKVNATILRKMSRSKFFKKYMGKMTYQAIKRETEASEFAVEYDKVIEAVNQEHRLLGYTVSNWGASKAIIKKLQIMSSNQGSSGKPKATAKGKKTNAKARKSTKKSTAGGVENARRGGRATLGPTYTTKRIMTDDSEHTDKEEAKRESGNVRRSPRNRKKAALKKGKRLTKVQVDDSDFDNSEGERKSGSRNREMKRKAITAVSDEESSTEEVDKLEKEILGRRKITRSQKLQTEPSRKKKDIEVDEDSSDAESDEKQKEEDTNGASRSVFGKENDDDEHSETGEKKDDVDDGGDTVKDNERKKTEEETVPKRSNSERKKHHREGEVAESRIRSIRRRTSGWNKTRNVSDNSTSNEGEERGKEVKKVTLDYSKSSRGSKSEKAKEVDVAISDPLSKTAKSKKDGAVQKDRVAGSQDKPSSEGDVETSASNRCAVAGCNIDGPAAHCCKVCKVPMHNLCGQRQLGKLFIEGKHFCSMACILSAASSV